MKIRHFILLLSAAAALCACNPVESQANTEYKIAPENMIFSYQGGTQILNVQTDSDVKVSSNAVWCVVDEQVSQSAKMVKYSVTVPANPDIQDRVTELEVSIGSDVSVAVKVIQESAALLVDMAQVNLPYEASTFSINVLSSDDYDVAIQEAQWLTLLKKEGSSALFDAKENASLYPRQAVITFKSGKETYEVIVLQDGCSAGTIAPDKTGMGSDAKTLMKKMHLGINLGNTLEAIGGETAWGAPYTKEVYIKYFKELGFNAVRIPCSWNQNLEDGEGYVIKNSWLERVKEVVDYVVNNDMYAILNIHWDGGWLENDIPNGYDEKVDAQQKAIWTQIAVAFREYDEHLLFAGTNEPNVENAAHMNTLLRYEQTFIDAVRATGGKNAYRVLVFQGPSTDVDKTDQLMNVLPKDNVPDRLAAEVHYYTPWQFCGLTEDASWGKMMYFWGDDQKNYAVGSYAGRWLGGYNEAHIAKQMAKMKKKFWDNGIPVIIGEYSVCSTRNCNLGTEEENKKAAEGYAKSRAAFNACVVRESKANGCVPFYWHCEGDLIDRSEMRVTEQETYEAIIEAGKTEYPNN